MLKFSYPSMKYRLTNGLLVALQERPTQTVAGRLRVGRGALNELPDEEGLVHFLEHILITGGTQKYTPEEAEKIHQAFGSFNGVTDTFHTYFSVNMLADDTPLFLEFTSDVAFRPRFDASRIEEERQRILREISDRKSQPDYKIVLDYYDAFFGRDAPQKRMYYSGGKEEVVSSATVEKLREFHSQGYHPNNMDLILVGALPQNIDALIEQHFGHFPMGNGKKAQLPRNNPLSGVTVIHAPAPYLLNKDHPEQSMARMGLSLYAPTESDEDSPAANVLTEILGGSAISRLFSSISQKKGLAYRINADYQFLHNQGAIHIYGSIHAQRVEEALDAIFEEMNKLRTELVSSECLSIIKKSCRYYLANRLETNSDLVHSLEAAIDRSLTPELFLEKVEAVTPEQIREAAIKYLPSSRAEGKYVLCLSDPLKV